MIDLAPKIALGPERRDAWGNWSREATVEGFKFRVSVARGNSVRMAYAGNKRGFKWHGRVTDEQGQTLWSGECTKSTGAAGLLEAAGVITRDKDYERQVDRLVWCFRDSVDKAAEHAKLTQPRRSLYGFGEGGPNCRCNNCKARRLSLGTEARWCGECKKTHAGACATTTTTTTEVDR